MPEFPRTARYKPTVVWSTGTPVNTSQYDDVSQYYLNSPGLVIDGIGRDQARAYSPPAAMAFDFTLNNWSGRFSPGGPIGSMVSRGANTYLDIIWGIDQLCNSPVIKANDKTVTANGIVNTRLFEGILNTADQILTMPSRTVQCRALGKMSTLLDKRPRTNQLYENIATDAAISILLDLCGWPADKRNLDSGDTTLTYWWMDGKTTALDMLNRILGAEGAGGCAYEQAGVFYFEGRQTRELRTRSLEEQWLFATDFNSDPGANSASAKCNDPNTLANGAKAGFLYQDIVPSESKSNPDEVIASARVPINNRGQIPAPPTAPNPQTYGPIWELGGPIDVLAGTTTLIPIETSDPFKSVQTLTAVDYTVTSGAITSIALRDITDTLAATSGVAMILKIVTPPGSGAHIIGGTGGSNGIQVRALSLPISASGAVLSTIDTSTVALRYAAKELTMDNWPEISYSQALDIANSMVRRYQQERRQSFIKVANIDGNHMLAMQQFRISDRVRWVQKHGNINDPYWIEQIHHEIAPGGGLHTVTLGLERVFDVNGARFDSVGSIGGFDIGLFGE